MSDLERIRKFPDKTRTALAYLDEPIIICDLKGTLIYLNPRGEEIFGLDYKLSIGRHLKELLPIAVSQEVLRGLDKIKLSRKSERILISENERLYFAQLNPILQKGQVCGAIVCLRRETEEEKIQRLNQALFQNLLDEIYRPINQLTVLFSRELENQLEYEKLYQNSQSLVKKSIQALNDLIDVSPVLIGEIKLAKNRFPPSRLLKLAVRSFRPRAERKKARLLRLDDRDLEEVIGDEARLNRVFVILLDLLLEHIPPGQIIALSAEVKRFPEPILVYSLSASELVKTEKDFPALFGELPSNYQDLSPQEKLLQKNLLIASRLLWAMKAELKIVSQKKIGTTISFALPTIIAEKEEKEE